MSRSRPAIRSSIETHSMFTSSARLSRNFLIRDVFQDTRSVPEPAGTIALAGLKQYAEAHGLRGATLAAIISGANLNFDRLRFVAERAEVGEQREAIFAVTIPEERGSFRRFCSALGQHSITEFNYRIGDPARAHLFVGCRQQVAMNMRHCPIYGRVREAHGSRCLEPTLIAIAHARDDP